MKRTWLFKCSILVVLLISFPCSVNALCRDSMQCATRSTHYLALDVGPSYILPTNAFFKGNNGIGKHLMWGKTIALKYSFKFPWNSYWGKMYPGAYQGAGISFHQLGDSKELGDPITFFIYQGSIITPLPYHFSLGYEWRFGGAFGWHPYDKQSNPNNIIMGKNNSFYMSVGLYINRKITPNFSISIGGFATHFSNGNTAYPNSGLNMLEPEVSLLYKFGKSQQIQKETHVMNAFQPASRWSVDLTLYGSTKVKGVSKLRYLVQGDFGVAGLNINPLYAVNRYLKFGPSLDFQYDESQNIGNHLAGKDMKGNYRFYRQPFKECLFLGTSLRGEFVMPVYSINFGLGYAAID